MVSVLKTKPAYWHLIKFAVVIALIGGIFLLRSPYSFLDKYKSGNQRSFASARIKASNVGLKRQSRLNRVNWKGKNGGEIRGTMKRKNLLSTLAKNASLLKRNWLPQANSSISSGFNAMDMSPNMKLDQVDVMSTVNYLNANSLYKMDDDYNTDILYGDEDDDEDDGNSPICHRLPFYPGDKCQFAQGNCFNPLAGGTLNYLQIRYCIFSSGILYYFCIAVWLLVLFYLLGNTAEVNFCPSLTEISELLRLSPDVSGVTLLAFGNGAPDIASIMAGALTGSSGFVLGEPIGSGLFITTGIFAAVTMLSNVKVEAVPFLRDAFICLVGITFCFFVYLGGRFELWHSLACLFIYFCYVLFVILGKHVYQIVRKIKRKIQYRKIGTEAESLLGTGAQINYSSIQSPSNKGRWISGKVPLWEKETSRVALIDDAVVDYFRSSQQVYASQYFPKVGIVYQTNKGGTTKVISPNSIAKNEISLTYNKEDNELIDDIVSDVLIPEESARTLVIEDHFAPLERIPADDEIDHTFYIVKLVNEFLTWIRWRDMSSKDRIFYIIASPTILARNLTIPISTKEDWSKFFAVLSPIFIPWFLLWVVGYSTFMIGPVPLGLILTGVGFLFSILIYLTSTRKKAPIYHPILVIISFFMGIAWIYVTANELVAVLQSIGILFQISDAIIAATVLTWGNSLGDMVADIVVSRNGFPDMACSAIFGGPTMNLLIGVGLSVSYHCLSVGRGFEMEPDATVLLTFSLVFVSLIGSLIIVPLSGFTSPKLYGFVLLWLYFFFMGVAVAMELGFLFPLIK